MLCINVMSVGSSTFMQKSEIYGFSKLTEKFSLEKHAREALIS